MEISKNHLISIVKSVEYPDSIDDEIWDHIRNNREMVSKTIKAVAEMVKNNIIEEIEKL